MPKMQSKLEVTILISEISCVVDHAKLSNLVTAAVARFIYFWRKMKAFRPLEDRSIPLPTIYHVMQTIHFIHVCVR